MEDEEFDEWFEDEDEDRGMVPDPRMVWAKLKAGFGFSDGNSSETSG